MCEMIIHHLWEGTGITQSHNNALLSINIHIL